MIRDDETPSLDLESDDGFEQLLGAAVHYRIATGPHAGRKALTLRTVASNPPASNPCIAQLSGFSLHAGTRCQAHERDSLERLCRYIARPAVSNERLSVNDRGQVVYRLKHPFRNGTTHVVLDPIDSPSTLSPASPPSCRVPAPISPDTTACSPRTSNTAAVSSPALPIKPPASLMRRVPRP